MRGWGREVEGDEAREGAEPSRCARIHAITARPHCRLTLEAPGDAHESVSTTYFLSISFYQRQRPGWFCRWKQFSRRFIKYPSGAAVRWTDTAGTGMCYIIGESLAATAHHFI